MKTNRPGILFTAVLISSLSFAQGPGGVSPELWYKPGDDVFSDAGVTPATDGDPVQEWHDQSGVSEIMSNTGSARPIFLNNATDNFNGYPVIDFNGIDHFLRSTSTGIIGNDNPYTKIVVFNNNTGPNMNLLSSGPSGDHAMYFPTPSLTAFHGGSDYISSIAASTGETYIGTIRYNGSISTTPDNIIGLNSNYTIEPLDQSFTDGGRLQIGQYLNASSTRLNGRIAEVILYTSPISDADLQKVESYLAIKYGITLDATNYVSSNGTIIWNTTTNSGYLNNVGGIGRDISSDLNQTQSQSQNSESVLSIQTSATLVDQQFFLWGTNNETLDLTSSGVISGRARLSRIWRAQETTDFGSTLTLEFQVNQALRRYENLEAGDITLLIDNTDTDFSDVTPITATSYDGTTITFSGIDIDDGDYFTIGVPAAGPGGITTNLSLWVRADNQVYNDLFATVDATNGDEVLQINDNSLLGNNMISATVEAPTFLVSNINFNPVLDFDGIDDDLGLATSGIIGDNGDYTKFVVHIIDDFSVDNNLLSSLEHAFWYGRTNTIKGWHRNNNIMSYDLSQSVLIPYIGVVKYNHILFDDLLKINGDQFVPASDVSRTFEDNNLFLGSLNNGGFFLDGKIAEAIIFTEALSASDIQKVESYLAIKYGITLNPADESVEIEEGDYVASNGTIVWDYSANSSYHNDVAGIGRDDISNLDQPKSQSENTGSVLLVGNGSDLNAPDVVSTDESFLIWGNDGGDTNFTTTIDNESVGTSPRLARVWKLQETGSLGTVTVAVPGTIGGLTGTESLSVVIHPSNPAFPVSGGRSAVDMTYNSTAGRYEAEIDITTSTAFLTFANNTASVLPIELLSFRASWIQEENVVQVRWKTASEINNDFFTLERSSDGKSWEAISQIDGAGYSSEVRSYTFSDIDYLPVTYYRLRQTDFDGRYEYSEILRVITQRSFIIYPNPTDGQLYIVFERAPENGFNLIMRSIDGRLALEHYFKANGSIKASVDISNLKTGIYFAEIEGRPEIVRIKIN